MSSAGQIVGGIVGAVVGWFVGGPYGVIQGAALGAGIGGVLDPPKGPTVQGPRLQDKGVQTSTYGAAIPRIYGTIAGGGNIIQLENNKLKETVRKKSSGGKGGGGSVTTKTYTYSATFQLSLCEGPIAGVRRIWCGDKLIYNAGSDDLETIIASNQAATGFRVYLGTDDQLPDPRYEAEYGVGNVSAHRGEAYIAFYDFQLADYSNTLQGAQFKVEIVGSATTQGLRTSYEMESPVTFDDAPPKVTSGNGIISVFYNPADPRKIGDATGWVERKIRISDGSTISVTSAGLPTNAGSTDARGNFGAYSWKWDWVGSGDPKSFFKAYDPDGNLIVTLTRYSGEANVFAANIENGFMYCYRQRADGSQYIEKLDDELEILETFEADSLISAGTNEYPPVMDSQEQIIWAMPASGTNIIIYRLTEGVFVNSGSISSDSGIGSNGMNGSSSDGILSAFYKTQLWVINSNNLIIPDLPPLAGIITSEVQYSGIISSADIDVSEMSQQVRGYRISGGSIRAALEPLQAAFPFDVRQHGYKIQFLPRGQASVETIPWEDLGATSGEAPDDIFRQSREMDSQLPARTAIKYLDAAREYAISEQYSERLNTEAVNRVDRELPLVLTADEAAGVAEVLNFLPWLERTDAAFNLPPKYRHLEPGDVITVPAPQATYELRLTETSETQDGRVECKARPNRAALYTSTATGAEGVPPTGTIGLGGLSLFVPLDIPVVDETLQNAPGFVGVMTGYSDGWPGALAVRSSDGGQTWVDLQGYTGKASIGIAVGTLPASSGTLIDQRTLTVGMISGEPEGITRDQMLAGANYAAYGLDGRWEILRFQNSTLQADGSYLLSGFVRGERGTEWATGLHSAGDYFVLLEDTDNAFIGMPIETIGLDRTYRGVTSGDSIDDATDVSFTYNGVNLECLSPVYANGVRDGSSNFTGTFTRRSRLSSSWWTAGVVAPVGETTESYEIDVMNGSSVVRTITASSPTFAYSAANQTTDFGSAQSSITFKIYQLSETVGRGYPLEVTL